MDYLAIAIVTAIVPAGLAYTLKTRSDAKTTLKENYSKTHRAIFDVIREAELLYMDYKQEITSKIGRFERLEKLYIARAEMMCSVQLVSNRELWVMVFLLNSIIIEGVGLLSGTANTTTIDDLHNFLVFLYRKHIRPEIDSNIKKLNNQWW